jgi:hypothetical protein
VSGIVKGLGLAEPGVVLKLRPGVQEVVANGEVEAIGLAVALTVIIASQPARVRQEGLAAVRASLACVAMPIRSYNPSVLDSRDKRRMAIGCLCALLLVVIAGPAAWVAVVMLSSTASLSDRLAEAGVIIAGGTLVLALIAAVVAVMAYAAATGLPDLKLQVSFPSSDVNRPRFQGRTGEEDGWFYAQGYKQTTGTVLLRNESAYSAKNPAVIVRLQNLYFLGNPDATLSSGWVVIGFASALGITAVQWDGGPNYSVHGKSVRQLPRLRLEELKHPVDRGPAGLTFELLADGYRREVYLPVELHLTAEQEEPGEQDRAEPEQLPPVWL